MKIVVDKSPNVCGGCLFIKHERSVGISGTIIFKCTLTKDEMLMESAAKIRYKKCPLISFKELKKIERKGNQQ